MYLADIFREIADLFFDLALLCYRIADWFEDNMGWTWMHNRFDDLYDVFKWVNYTFRDAAKELDNWWDEICWLWDDLNDLWDYAHYWLKDKIDEALGWATIAYTRAAEALTKVNAIAGVIGTTASQIIQFIRDYAVITYQYITENIYNTFQTFNEYIYNTYQTINEYFYNTYNTFKEYIYNTYQTINEYFYNTYNTFKEYITNVWETINHIYETYITEIIGVTEDIVRDLINAALAPFTAPINLVSYWFDDIQDFFNDPLGWLWVRFTDWFLGPE